MNIIKIKKWIENYWYHYKWYTIITLLVTFMVAIAVSTHTPVEKYDFNIPPAKSRREFKITNTSNQIESKSE